MVSNQITEYLESLTPNRNELLLKMEEYAKVYQIPIMELVGIECMLQMLRLFQPQHILEIGTAIGYSAIRMAEALPDSKIVTIERDKDRYDKAIEYINEANLTDRITVIFADALDAVEQVKKLPPFDALFIDAAKGKYEQFFELYSPMVKEQGIIISDNVLFRGLVAQDDIDQEQKRLHSIAKKINRYNQWLLDQSAYKTTIFPVGDGIAISIKK